MADNTVELKIESNLDGELQKAKKLAKELQNINKEDNGISVHPFILESAGEILKSKSVSAEIGKALENILKSGKFTTRLADGSTELKNLELAMSSLGSGAKEMGVGKADTDTGKTEDSVNKLSKALGSLTSKFANISKASKKAGKDIEKTGDKTGEAGKKANKSASFFDKFANRLKSIIMYRFIRGGLSKISQYFNEGIQNLVKYETALNGIAGSKATATMNALSTSLQTLKNSIGAMGVSVLAYFQPVIQTLIEWLVKGINAINMFFVALQGGGTYKKATTAVYNYAKAVSSLKNELLSFDELNVLGSSSSTNDGGTSYEDMFEDAEVEGWATNTATKIQSALEKIKNVFADFTLPIKDLLFSDETTWETVAGALIDTLGLITGGIIGFKLGGVKGAIIGSIAGVVLTAFVRNLLFEDDGKLEPAELKTMLYSVIGAIVGGLLGVWTGYGAIKGAILGFSVTMGLQALVKGMTSEGDCSYNTIESFFTLFSPALTSMFGGLAGLSIGKAFGVKGAIIGFTIGTLLTFAVSSAITNKDGGNFEDILTDSNTGVFDVDPAQYESTTTTTVVDILGTKNTKKILKKASGGVPTTGTLFWAGEAGAEVIGSVGGRTTVYNADQLGNAMSTANADVVNAINTLIGVVQKKSGNVTISASDIRKAVNTSAMRVGI